MTDFDKTICTGCSKAGPMRTFPYVHRCIVYPAVPGAYVRAGLCPFNPPVVKSKKDKTKGQQKQGRNR